MKALLTEVPCPRCLKMARDGRLRIETVQRLPVGAFAPQARDGSGSCCRDCSAADAVERIVRLPSFYHARVAVANDRQEQYRLPGISMGLVRLGFVAASEVGDLADQYRWLDVMRWFGLEAEVEGDRATPISETRSG